MEERFEVDVTRDYTEECLNKVYQSPFSGEAAEVNNTGQREANQGGKDGGGH